MSRLWLLATPLLLLLSACATEHEFGLEPGGDAAADKPQDAQNAIAPGGSIIVAAGNILLGPAAALARSPSGFGTTAALGTADQTALVSGVLLSSGQTIVQLDSGAALLIGGTGATIGDTVTLSPVTGMVTSGPAGLIGSSVQSASPTIVAPVIATGTPVPTSLGGTGATSSGGTPSLNPVTGTLPPVGTVLGGGCC